MTIELLLTLLFFLLVSILGYIFIFRLKKHLPYLPLRFFLFLVAVAILALLLATFELLPNAIGIAFLFLVEVMSFASVLYFAIGLLLIIFVIMLTIIVKARRNNN